jgi:hypothetical protein
MIPLSMVPTYCTCNWSPCGCGSFYSWLNKYYALQECLSNAKYAINIARKIGAPVYALPEDISEVRNCFSVFKLL